MNPDKPGFWIFHGTRTIGTTNHIRRVDAPVEIVHVWNRRGCELAVKLIGRQQNIPLSAFEGTWSKIVITEEPTP